MIVEFSVKNFRSINELQTLSFVATGLKSAEKFTDVDKNNISQDGDTSLFKTLGIYGANASGKSNIIKAFDYFIKVISSQPSSISNLGSLCQPFLYQKDSETTESFFQIVLIIKGIKYRYGLTVKKNLSKNKSPESSIEIITNEWLFANKQKNMSPLFERVGNRIEKNNLKNKTLIPQTLPYEHSLFLTHAAAFDKKGDCKIITNYLMRLTTSNFNTNHEKFRWLSIHYLNDDKNLKSKENFLHLLSTFNLKYVDVFLENENDSTPIEIFSQDKITLSKILKINNENLTVSLNLRDNESAGTQKMFDLAGLLLRAFSLPESAFIILDEIDSNFHPYLLIKLVGLFNDPKINKSNSQLLFTSHDTNLMSPSIMRRDQFYFTEKREDDSTRLYSLSDLRGIRNDADFAKQYLAGYYGALPVLDEYCLKPDEIVLS